MKELQEKIEDYTRFGQILLAVSTLLMVGLLIPTGAKETIQFFVMIGSIVIFFKFIFLFLSACESDARQVRGKRMRIILINSALQKEGIFFVTLFFFF